MGNPFLYDVHTCLYGQKNTKSQQSKSQQLSFWIGPAPDRGRPPKRTLEHKAGLAHPNPTLWEVLPVNSAGTWCLAFSFLSNKARQCTCGGTTSWSSEMLRSGGHQVLVGQNTASCNDTSQWFQMGEATLRKVLSTGVCPWDTTIILAELQPPGNGFKGPGFNHWSSPEEGKFQ